MSAVCLFFLQFMSVVFYTFDIHISCLFTFCYSRQLFVYTFDIHISCLFTFEPMSAVYLLFNVNKQLTVFQGIDEMILFITLSKERYTVQYRVFLTSGMNSSQYCTILSWQSMSSSMY